MSKQCDIKLNEPVASASSRVVPRWQRKENEKSSKAAAKTNSNNASFSSQSNVSSTFGESFSGETRKTPGKRPSLSLNMPYKTTNLDGTPKKKVSSSLKNQNKVGTPKKLVKSGKRSTHTTPSGDRFIPPRSANNFEESSFELLNGGDESKISPTSRRYKDSMKQNLSMSKPKILNMRNKAPEPATNILNPQSKVSDIYSVQSILYTLFHYRIVFICWFDFWFLVNPYMHYAIQTFTLYIIESAVFNTRTRQISERIEGSTSDISNAFVVSV